ncbi:MAG: PocR ligand-binding domain-containing protein [Eubacterium aggregans]|uniref:Helix-turn-helix domain-containing protein n=1 Tax=Eubacterium aggregans TaxID=81409 RepID=A0A1H4A2M9_9FIRM|nr:PocR ligand-binding domain-containing protein [Eubacterium aggregans]MDD4691642.1 PocR ligand-binding domain-containing protein [Eubacterium aggregans]MEA5074260.1 PocR ligand-binding domain-containing protein [Eubacterium aggregans]SEA30068.1 Helix-turn-helix domain-containing protein [Eubacterium aggregans]
MNDYNHARNQENRKKLLQLVDKDFLKQILDAFSAATGLTANIVDVEGKSIFSAEDSQKNCDFCKIIRRAEREKGVDRCQGAYARAGKQAAIFNEPYIFRCPAGLIEWAAPIIIDEENLGTIICGQILMWDPEAFFWIELEEMNTGVVDDLAPLFEAAKELQVISGDKVQHAAFLLYIIANFIVRSAFEQRNQQKELKIQHSLLNQEIQTRKELEKQLNSQSLNFYMEKENALIGKINIGDYEECLKLYKVMLSDIFSEHTGDLGTIRARVCDLTVAVSRSMITKGVEPQQSIVINTEFFKELHHCYDIGEIYDAAVKLVQTYIKKLERQGKNKNKSAIQGIKGYIRNHYKQNLTLEEIVDSVYLSPYYACRIFKESEGITVMDYVTMVRLEEAKKMLSNTKYKIDEIATILGYKDASYFSKVFRKNLNMTPTQFRNSQ